MYFWQFWQTALSAQGPEVDTCTGPWGPSGYPRGALKSVSSILTLISADLDTDLRQKLKSAHSVLGQASVTAHFSACTPCSRAPPPPLPHPPLAPPPCPPTPHPHSSTPRPLGGGPCMLRGAPG